MKSRLLAVSIVVSMLPALGVVLGYLHPFVVEGTITVEEAGQMIYNATVSEAVHAFPALPRPEHVTYTYTNILNPLYYFYSRTPPPTKLKVPIYRGVEAELEPKTGVYEFTLTLCGQAMLVYGGLGAMAGGLIGALAYRKEGKVAVALSFVALLSFMVSFIVSYTVTSLTTMCNTLTIH